jgi:hypothetical protein
MRITIRTKALLGASVFPHALRHGAATTPAIERPELIEIVTPLLQRRHMCSRQRYNMADGVAAGGDFGEAIEARRIGSRDGPRPGIETARPESPGDHCSERY